MENCQDINEETYRLWKKELAEKGKNPMWAVEFCRSIGMNDYANDLEAVIAKMEAHIRGLA